MSDIEDGQLTEEKTIRLLRQVEPGISVKEEGTQCDFNNAGLDTRRVKYGSTQVSNAERLCNLESENAKLKRLLAEAHLEIYEFKNVLGV
jgi:putative transposase